jgi:mono/diheme cytochrome c family protein
MNIRSYRPLLLTALALAAQGAIADPAADIDRGRYLVQLGGCNDCHTPGYPQADGKVPVGQWLTGNAVGFQGPWGTSYPANLRLVVRQLTEAQWLERARQPMRPPMPWFNLRDASDRDLVAIYRFITSLGPAGEPAPLAAAPGVPVATPYIEFVPKHPAKLARH